MELDADSYVYNFCRKNVEKCERFINRDYWLMKKKDNKNLYEDVKRIKEQLNELQDQHLILLHQLGKINSRVGALENQSEWISNSGIVIAWNFGAGLLLIAEDQFAIKNLDKEMICG